MWNSPRQWLREVHVKTATYTSSSQYDAKTTARVPSKLYDGFCNVYCGITQHSHWNYMCLHMDIDERPERKEPLQLEFNDQSRSVLHFLCEESNPTDLNRNTGWQWLNRMVNTWQWFDRDQDEDLTTGYCCGHRAVTCRASQLHVNFLEGR